MFAQRIVLTGLIIMLGIVILFAWLAWNDGHFGLAHVVGLGASVLLLLVIWFWPGIRQPTQPPP